MNLEKVPNLPFRPILQPLASKLFVSMFVKLACRHTLFQTQVLIARQEIITFVACIVLSLPGEQTCSSQWTLAAQAAHSWVRRFASLPLICLLHVKPELEFFINQKILVIRIWPRKGRKLQQYCNRAKCWKSHTSSNTLFLFLFTGATWYDHGIYIVFT